MTEPDAALVMGELGAALLDAGYAVTDASRIVSDAAAVQGLDLTIGMLPSAVLVGEPATGRTQIVSSGTDSWTFDQMAEVATLARDAQLGRTGPVQIRASLETVARRAPVYPRWIAVLGSGLMSAAISVVFRTTWWAVVIDMLLALVVGAVMVFLGRSPRLIAVLPFFAATAVSVVVYALADDLELGAVTLFVVCAPLVILIPGATITNGVLEVAAGDVVSGGGRLVSGALMWATLALGIIAGAAMAGTSIRETTGAAHVTAQVVPAWAIAPAIVVLAIGVGLFFGASRTLILVLSAVLGATYSIVAISQIWTSPAVASGIAAAVILPATRLLEVHWPALPSSVTFRPAFWLLVPGSLGLVTISTFAAGSSGTSGRELISGVLATVVAISVGVQLGALTSEVIGPRARAAGHHTHADN